MNVLVIAAHPDDEVLGCGGTIARLSKEGHTVSVAILGEGVTSRYVGREEVETELRVLRDNCQKASDMLGVTNLQTFNLPDNKFDTIPLLNIIKIIERIIENLKPECVYTHHYSDLNIDHAITYRATLTATRPIGSNPVKTVLAYEVPSSTEWTFRYDFKPNVFVDISKTLPIKIAAMETYEGEICEFPHPRSSESLKAIAFRWGTVVGMNAVEAFELVREIR
jgi:LmbE family N-acetylglucosaminyl deacetylase